MTRRIEWIDPDGGVTPLNIDGDVIATPGVNVAGMPTIAASEYVVPMQPGARWRNVMHGPREVAVPVAILGTPSEPVEVKLDRLVHAIDPTRGVGRLRVTRNDGTTRELSARYVDSLSVSEARADTDTWQAALVFRAVDPYWVDGYDSVIRVAPERYTGLFFPLFPLRLGDSETVVEAHVANTGHVPAWPVITVTGPLDDVLVENLTTGKKLAIGVSVEEGETIVVDTRPGVKTVVSDVNGNLFAEAVRGGSTLWPLAVGNQTIRVTFGGSEPDVSEVSIAWRRGWLSV